MNRERVLPMKNSIELLESTTTSIFHPIDSFLVSISEKK